MLLLLFRCCYIDKIYASNIEVISVACIERMIAEISFNHNANIQIFRVPNMPVDCSESRVHNLCAQNRVCAYMYSM